eukprot:scaffold4651_cov18-Tisochrysis_lutea.AAC.3
MRKSVEHLDLQAAIAESIRKHAWPKEPGGGGAWCAVHERPVDETQETLRTSAFPSQHVKEKWAKNLYLAGIAYGRTVS